MRLAAGGFEHRPENTVAEENVRLNVRHDLCILIRPLANAFTQAAFLAQA